MFAALAPRRDLAERSPHDLLDLARDRDAAARRRGRCRPRGSRRRAPGARDRLSVSARCTSRGRRAALGREAEGFSHEAGRARAPRSPACGAPRRGRLLGVDVTARAHTGRARTVRAWPAARRPCGSHTSVALRWTSSTSGSTSSRPSRRRSFLGQAENAHIPGYLGGDGSAGVGIDETARRHGRARRRDRRADAGTRVGRRTSLAIADAHPGRFLVAGVVHDPSTPTKNVRRIRELAQHPRFAWCG